MKRMIPIGMAFQNDFLSTMKADDFSNDHYDGVQLRRGRNNGMVLIMHSNRKNPFNWMVAYGFSTVFFPTFKDAVEFCQDHGMKLINTNDEYRSKLD